MEYFEVEEESIIDEKYADIYSILSAEPISINQICKTSRKSIAEVNEMLFMLEIEGKVKSLPGGFYCKIN